jgi:hypothetical protein
MERAMPSKTETAKSYEIKITLLNLEPAIWRRVLVPRDITLGKLHYVIQIAMGWDDEHLHEFVIARKRYGPLMPDPIGFGEPLVNEDMVHLNGVAKPKAKFVYLYDFGDDWQHEIRIERELKSTLGQRQAICIAGENACPPEDCGGTYGYPELLAILSNPQHEEYDEMRDWVDEDFDPSRFDLTATDHRLSHLKV